MAMVQINGGTPALPASHHYHYPPEPPLQIIPQYIPQYIPQPMMMPPQIIQQQMAPPPAPFMPTMIQNMFGPTSSVNDVGPCMRYRPYTSYYSVDEYCDPYPYCRGYPRRSRHKRYGRYYDPMDHWLSRMCIH